MFQLEIWDGQTVMRKTFNTEAEAEARAEDEKASCLAAFTSNGGEDFEDWHESDIQELDPRDSGRNHGWRQA